MKKLLERLKAWFQSQPKEVVYHTTDFLQPHSYDIKYAKDLTPQQKMKLINSMFNYFAPNCRPTKLTVGSCMAELWFDTPCISGNELKTISDACLKGTQPESKIEWIGMDGHQIWPSKTNPKKSVIAAFLGF